MVAPTTSLTEIEARLAYTRIDGQTAGPTSRYVVVRDTDGWIIGHLDNYDLIKSLDPAYRTMAQAQAGSRFGYPAKLFEAMTHDMALFATPLDDLCRTAGGLQAEEIMTPLDLKDAVEADASINLAIHHLIVSHSDPLLVCEEGSPVGLIGLSGVLAEISLRIRRCVV